MTDRVVLAYSGGLDTSVAISWIGKETGAEVVAVAIDLGQGGEDMEVVGQRALDCGAVESIVIDARESSTTTAPTIKANGMYMREYRWWPHLPDRQAPRRGRQGARWNGRRPRVHR